MRIDRLKRLAEFLETVDDTKFNIHSWYIIDHNYVPLEKIQLDKNNTVRYADGGIYYSEEYPLLKNVDCGTSACALGWACSIPEFQEAGLALAVHNSDHFYTRAFPYYEGHSDIGAAEKFFDISEDQASSLFDPYYYYTYYTNRDKITKEMVIEKIEKMIEGYCHE